MICALSAMGIDCYTDPRFTNGTISVLSQFLSFANVSEGYFNHTAETPNDHMATYQGCYATQWYLAFLENGGQGNPCYFYYQRFDFSTQLSDAANILSFTLDGKEGQIEERYGRRQPLYPGHTSRRIALKQHFACPGTFPRGYIVFP